MEMKAKILSAKSADFIQTFNKQTQVSQARSIATSLASRPSTAGQKSVDAMPDDPPKLSRTAKKRAKREEAAEKTKAAAQKTTAEATRVGEAAKKKNDGPSRAPHKGVNPNAEMSSTECAPNGN
jgi:hypothetical protein